MAERWSNLIDEFVNVTGADRIRARSLLDATNGNLQMAVEMHFDSGATVGQASSSSNVDNSQQSVDISSSSSTDHRSDSSQSRVVEDEVRAPIPQTRGILVDEPYSTFGNRKRTSKSVFDAFRDFQAEARQQELEATGAGASKRRTLQDLFRPPIDLLHKGTFETAKVSGQQQSKWLLVNVQDVKEFQCQQLNRDVWSNDQVRSIIKANFVLWQVYRDTDEGERFIQFYHVSSYPHLAVVDPRTGEKLISWGFMEAQAFYECAREFLAEHPGLGEESPPPKKLKKNSIVDASEDSQLEAAIAESLRYSTSTANDNASNDDQNDDDYDLEFTDSDSDGETWVPQKISKGKTTANIKNNTEIQSTSTSSEAIDTNKRTKSNHDKNTNSENIQNNTPSSSSNNITKKGSSEVTSTSSSKSSNASPNTDCYKQWQEKEGPSCKIMLRFPHGGRKQVSLHADAPLLALVQFVQSEGFTNERFELVTHFPRKQLSYLDYAVTLKDAGLFPQETVFVQER